MALFTSGERAYFVPTALGEDGLGQTLSRYRSDPRHAGESAEGLLRELRWSPCDSPYHLQGEELDDDEYEELLAAVDGAACKALQILDREGVFGVGREREAVFVSILMGDQDDSILDFGKRLNPRSTYQRFAREWKVQSPKGDPPSTMGWQTAAVQGLRPAFPSLALRPPRLRAIAHA